MRAELLSPFVLAFGLALACGSEPEASPPLDDAGPLPDVPVPVDAAATPDRVPTDTPAPDDTGSTDVSPDTTEDTPEAPDQAEPADPGPSDPGPPPAPPTLFVTIARLPAHMNGSTPYAADDPEGSEYVIRANRRRLDLDVREATEGGPMDWSTLEVTCDVDLPLPDGTLVDAGEPIGADAFVEAGEGWHTAHFDTDNPAPVSNLVTCTAAGAGPGGAATPSTVHFESADLPTELDPFVTPDTWLVVMSRDLFELEVTQNPDGTVHIGSKYVPEGNGAPDLEEPLYVAGIMSKNAPEAAAWVRAWLLGIVRSEAYRTFALGPDGSLQPDSVPIHLLFEGDDGAPSSEDYAAGGLSMIALGGDGKPADQAATTVGKAQIDWNNQGHEDNTTYGRGVFVTAMIRQLLANPGGAALFSEFLPGVGTPFGEHPADAAIMEPGFDPELTDDPFEAMRYTLLRLTVELGGAAVASTLCHEMGHSLGLVAPGVPPEGLFAGVEPDFVLKATDGAHIDTEGLNVMQTGTMTELLDVEDLHPEFNPLNMAYLRRQIVVGAP